MDWLEDDDMIKQWEEVSKDEETFKIWRRKQASVSSKTRKKWRNINQEGKNCGKGCGKNNEEEAVEK